MKRFFPTLALALAFEANAQAQPATPAKIEIRLLKTTFAPDEAVDLQVDLVNTSAKTLNIGWSAFENSAFQFGLKNERGLPVKKTLEGERVLAQRFVASANIRLALKPQEHRRASFRLSNLFDLSAGGKFSVQVSRSLAQHGVRVPANSVLAPRNSRTPSVQKAARVPANQLRETATVIRSSPLSFAIEKAPVVRAVKNEAPFSSRAKWLLALNGGQIARFRIGDDGALQRTRQVAATAPRNSVAFVASLDGRFVYTIRPNTVGRTPDGGFGGLNDGAILGFQVEKDGFLTPLQTPTPLTNDFSTLALDAPRHRLISYTAYQHGQGFRDGGRAFRVELDGKLTPQRDFQLDGTSTLALSRDGELAFTANFPISAFRVAPNGQFSRLTAMGWHVAGPVEKESGANEVWVSPDTRFIAVQVEAKLSKPGAKERFVNGLATFRVQRDAAPQDFLGRVPGFFTARSGAALVSTKGIGFDPTGRFFLAQSERGDLLSFRVAESGALELCDQFAAHQKFNYQSERGYLPEQAVFDADARTFWTLGGGSVRAFRLDENGKISALGRPFSAGGTDFVMLETPLAASQATRARLNGEVFEQGEPIELELPLSDAKNARLTVQFLGQEWQLKGKTPPTPSPMPFLDAGQNDFAAPTAPRLPADSAARAQIAVARMFDVSRAGIYRLQIQNAGVAPLDLTFEVRDFYADRPFADFEEQR